ncbi:MAG TPA: hypothetical protein VKJ07_01800, partial [Mycobacteriales bacterium]|nr:hypothetical protein [Mycobacteriales bacterium]
MPGVSLGSTVTVEINTTGTASTTPVIPAASIRVGATNLTLSLGPVQVTGDIWVSHTSGGVTNISLANASLSFDVAGQMLTVDTIHGNIDIDATGVAGSIAGNVHALTTPFMTLSAGSVTVAFNSRPTAVGSLPAGPYVRVTVASATLTFSSGNTLVGSFSFERQHLASGDVTVITMSGLSATIAGTLTLTGGSGALVLKSSGYAGFVSGTVSSATATLRVNTTTGVDTTVDVGGVEVPIKYDATQVFSLSVSGTLDINGVLTIKGELGVDTTQSSYSVTATCVSICAGVGPGWLQDGSLNPLARGLLVTGANLSLTKTSGAFTLTASGTLQLVGIAGVSIGGQFAVTYNSTTPALSL